MNEEKLPGGQPGGEDPGSPHNAQRSSPLEPNQPARGPGERPGEHFEEHLGEPSGEPEEIRRRRRRRNIFLVLIVVILALAFLYYHSRKASSAASAAAAKASVPAAAAITVGQSKTGDINIYVNAMGTVTPTYTVTVYSQITGQVMAVHYREGQMVRKGDPLIDIDPRPYEATLLQAQGNLEHDQGVLAEARMDLERYKEALAKNAIAKQQYEDQEQLVVQTEGSVKSDQGTVAYDRVQLAYCHITALISGQVGLRLVDPGNTVFSGSSSVLVVITQLQPITVVFNVAEDSLPQVEAQLKGGHKLSVDAFNRSDDKVLESGKLISLDNQVDTTTGTLKFRAEFPNKDLSLFPNQFVNARLLVNTLKGVTLVPSAAVQHNGTAAFVYIVQPNNTVSVQAITTLTSDQQVTAVQGINPGLTVATSGFDRLENGAQVSVRGQNAQHQGGTAPGGGS
jgi:membrane fusion protein, multidrug efflux system